MGVRRCVSETAKEQCPAEGPKRLQRRGLVNPQGWVDSPFPDVAKNLWASSNLFCFVLAVGAKGALMVSI